MQPAPHPSLTHILRTSLVVLLVLRAGGVFAGFGLSGTFLNLQDRWLLLIGLGLAAACALPPGRRAPVFARPLLLSRRAVLVVALALVAVCYAGHYLLLMGYDLSRDEQMASFDSAIYASRHLVWPLPPSWQQDAAALNLMFMLPVSHPVAWVSAYLPLNAAGRALLGMVADPALAGPLYTGGAALLVWSCARRLWPDDREAAGIALVVLALSGQVVVTGMTAYAMPAHLFWNLVWLRLFLQRDMRCDMAALVAGFIATGLHQPLFHPMFVAPWLLLVLLERQWRRLALFVLGYGAIGLFWLAWPAHIHALVSGPQSLDPVQSDYVSRLVWAMAQNHQNLAVMACNLLRFCTWQMVALLPLLIAGLIAARRERNAAAMALGLALPAVVMLVILPYQGHGFGYRYWHGAMGNVALLGAYGWRALRPVHETVRPLVLRAAVASLLVLLPVQAGMAHRLYAPYAGLSARIDASGADYAMIGGGDGPYAGDLVLNRPDLANRPLRLALDEITDEAALARRFCARPARVALMADSFYDPVNALFDAPRMGKADARLAAQSALLSAAGCQVQVLR